MLLSAFPVAQLSHGFQLLAFSCTELTPGEPLVVQFEREGFPPFSDTGLFASNGQQIAYVEQGSVSVFGDQIGRATGDQGFSAVVDAQSSLGIRNEALDAASVLWLRIVPALDRSQMAADASSSASGSIQQAAAPFSQESGLPPVFYEFDLPDSVTEMEQAHLFMARLDLEPASGIDPIEEAGNLTTSGIVAIVVESGTVRVDDETVARTLNPGEGMTVAGDGPYAVTNSAESPAVAFLMGIVAGNDEGRAGTEIASTTMTDRLCPEAW
jgi:hypothetical protein